MQDDAGAGRGTLGDVGAEAALTRRLPAVGLLGAGGTADHLDPLGHQERAVEADAELADELGGVRALLLELLQELARAGPRDRAQALFQLLFAHADAVVGNGEGAL